MNQDLNEEMRNAASRQYRQRTESERVNRTGWTTQQWVDDTRSLMDHIDGAVTSLVNGHVMALLDQNAELAAENARLRRFCDADIAVAEAIRERNQTTNSGPVVVDEAYRELLATADRNLQDAIAHRDWERVLYTGGSR